jgi:biopolymer transport protein TolR
MKRQESKRSRVLCRIDITGFAGVLIALLVMFMVYRQAPDLPRDVPVDLAKADHSIPMPGADREDALIVAVQRDGRIFFDTARVAPEDLTDRIKDRLRHGAPQPIYIKADARARYRAVAAALDGIRHAGVEKVGILTDRRREGWPATRD